MSKVKEFVYNHGHVFFAIIGFITFLFIMGIIETNKHGYEYTYAVIYNNGYEGKVTTNAKLILSDSGCLVRKNELGKGAVVCGVMVFTELKKERLNIFPHRGDYSIVEYSNE